MKIYELIAQLEDLAPSSLQESYDNAGLIVGDANKEVSGALVCLDSIEEVVEEAIATKCNLIIAHHPIVFSGLKSITGKNYIERVIIKAIKNDVAIYAIHTNLDNVSQGVNLEIANRLGLKKPTVLSPKNGMLKKLVFFCPVNSVVDVRKAIFEAGAGKIGNYDFCSFNINGEGTFRAGNESQPHVGEVGQLHVEKEVRVETVLPDYLAHQVTNALLVAHPYEEVAYDLYSIENKWNEIGSGMYGELEEPMDTALFLDLVKEQLNTSCIRHTKIIKEKIQRIAVCGGSGSFLLSAAKAKKADILITADFKYHQFFDADEEIVIADIGHFESEQFTPHLIQRYLKEKFPNFAIYLTKVNTNPINYR
jgi:dinuclear metal center YbgI/SA1388 family protein